ncbi:methionyl-tRNA formyltransferase [Blastopirellula sp. JC732]|uniref:Methionyl-tRNA formyltransferase n=1 Tax=Blastopirellula sediminis TaxID=2894196 RepID=A0A9X1SGJ0_9BACT|nr:methionyl-tRNA formyltransferase [Blastopirellula sediminis]MCC9607279.1 methionyl-tRNA formyltransferase [Blastopirellula sediminis]MCC9629428.1 methionyl-tRNA formyltransferase [Blastopirellula sediminis]
MLRIVMMGTGPFAVPSFRRLLDSQHQVLALLTQPPRVLRGNRQPPPSPMRAVAEEAGLPVHWPESVNTPEAHEILRSYDADLFVVCDYGQILSAESLSLAKLGGINLHGSLLPKYRGAAPVNWAMHNGDPETGVTVIHMTPKLDGGPILAVAKTPIDPDEDAVELEERLSQLGVEPVMQSIALLEEHGLNPPGELQDPAKVTKARRLRKEDGDLPWARTAQEIYNQHRAFQPWPGTFTHWLRDGAEPLRLIVKRMTPLASDARVAPGQVAAVDDGRLVVATAAGQISLDEVQPAGKRVMQAAEFLNGYGVRPGDFFGSFEPISGEDGAPPTSHGNRA